jgi:hypothetical protein
MIQFDTILNTCPDLSKYYDTIWYDSKNMSRLVKILWFNLIRCLDLSKTKRWRNTQKFEWMTDKVVDNYYYDYYYYNDYYKVIPWIASSKSSDQKVVTYICWGYSFLAYPLQIANVFYGWLLLEFDASNMAIEKKGAMPLCLFLHFIE